MTPIGRQKTICPMGRGPTKADFKADFCRRVQSARIAAGYNEVREFAGLMGIPFDTYARYENRTLLPHRHIPRFLELTGVSADVLFTGRRSEPQRKAV